MNIATKMRQMYKTDIEEGKFQLWAGFSDGDDIYLNSLHTIEELDPFFGFALQYDVSEPKYYIYVACDLPDKAYKFVLAHELYHCEDKTGKAWWWREIKANVVAGWMHPQGFFIVLWKTLTNWERIKNYIGFNKGTK